MKKKTYDRYHCDGPMCDLMDEVIAGATSRVHWRVVTIDHAPENQPGDQMFPKPKFFQFCPACIQSVFGPDYVSDEDVEVVDKIKSSGETLSSGSEPASL